MKFLRITLAVFLTTLLLFLPCVFASSEYIITVDTGARVRSNPDATSDSNVIMTLIRGETVTPTGKTSDLWIQIDRVGGAPFYSPDGDVEITGWIHLSLLATDLLSESGTITGNGRVALRESPSTDSALIKWMQPGDEVKLLAANGVWYKVQHGGSKGFVMKDFASK